MGLLLFPSYSLPHERKAHGWVEICDYLQMCALRDGDERLPRRTLSIDIQHQLISNTSLIVLSGPDFDSPTDIRRNASSLQCLLDQMPIDWILKTMSMTRS